MDMSIEQRSLLAKFNANLEPTIPEVDGLDFRPDIHVDGLDELDLDQLADMGVKHILVDYDGVFVDGHANSEIDDTALTFAQLAAEDSRFETVDIATDNGTSGPRELAPLISEKTRVFSAFDRESEGIVDHKAGKDGDSIFYRRVLYELGDAYDDPSTVVMIGDSPFHDVLHAQLAGMRTVLVKSLNNRNLPNFRDVIDDLETDELDEAGQNASDQPELHQTATKAGKLAIEDSVEKDSEPRLKIGVLKKISDRMGRSHSDKLIFDDDEKDLERKIKRYAGRKNISMHERLRQAIEYIAKNPQGSGSEPVKAFNNGARAPLFNNNRIKFLRFKPSEAQGLIDGLVLRDARIVYALVDVDEDEKSVGIIDIIDRGDFDKKYT